METYRVMNGLGVLVKVSAQDLDKAVGETGPLSVELANAAALAERSDLVDRLHETLAVTQRAQKLAAARALTVLHDTQAMSLLREHAARESDRVVSLMFSAFALRLEGTAALRRAFESGAENPELTRMIASIYGGQFVPTTEDLEFIVFALGTYLDGNASWLKDMKKDEWKNDVATLVGAVARDSAKQLLRSDSLATTRQRLQAVLERVTSSAADRDTKSDAKRLMKELA